MAEALQETPGTNPQTDTAASTETAASSVDHSTDRQVMEDKVAANLAATFGEEDDTPAEEVETEEKPAVKAADEVASSDEVVDETGAAETDEAKTAEEKAAAKSDPPTLPAEFRRSLKSYDWTDEEIDANLQQYGVKFLETAQKLHANRNSETARWAEAGRAARQQQAEQNKGTDAAKPAFAPVKLVDATKLKETYGEHALIDDLAGPVNAAIQQINAMMPAIQQTQASSQSAMLETLGKNIEAFFGDKDLEAYREIYGTADKARTKEQNDQRNKVLETADALIAGASMQGRQLSMRQAMTLAHDSISSSFKKQAVRQELTTTLKKRQAAISLKPGGKKSAPAAKPGDRASLEKVTKARLAAAFS